MPLNPLVDEVWNQFRGSWRFRWIAVATAAALALAGWLVVFSLEDRYEAEARIFVDPRSPLKQDIEAELNFVRQSLLADPSLERIARASRVLAASSSDHQRQALLADMRARIDIDVRSASGREEDRYTAGSIYRIAYQDHDPARSLRVVEALLETLVKETRADEREDYDKSRQSLESEIADSEKRMQMAGAELAAFKSAHPGFRPQGQRGDYLAELQKESDVLSNKLADAEARREPLVRQHHAPPGQPGSVESEEPLDTLIAQAKAHLDELLSKFTEKYPDVINARRTLEDLERRRTEEHRSSEGQSADASRASAELKQLEAEIDELRTEFLECRSKISEQRRYLEHAPQLDEEYAKLKREYEEKESQHAEVMAKREKLFQDERNLDEFARFKMVQPPAVTDAPVWPRRKLLLLAVLVGALGAGATLAYGLNSLFPVVDSSGSFARIISVPVLGEVTAAFPERDRQAFRCDLLRISMAAACLIAAFAVAVDLSQSGYRLTIGALRHLVNV